MPNADAYVAYITEQLGRIRLLSTKRMFGGLTFFSDGLAFAFVADNRFYMKVDDSNRPDFTEAGMEGFRPFGGDKVMQYFEVPAHVMEDQDLLEEWAGRAIEVAKRKKRKAPRRRSKR